MLYFGPERRVLRVPGQGPHQGLEFPLPPRGRAFVDGQPGIQNPETRDQNDWQTRERLRCKELDISRDEGRRTSGPSTRDSSRRVTFASVPITHIPYVVFEATRTTILPPTPRPTGRLPRGLCRCVGRRHESRNCTSIDPNIAAYADARNLRKNNRNSFANNSTYCDGFKLRSRSSLMSRQDERHDSRHRRLHK